MEAIATAAGVDVTEMVGVLLGVTVNAGIVDADIVAVMLTVTGTVATAVETPVFVGGALSEAAGNVGVGATVIVARALGMEVADAVLVIVGGGDGVTVGVVVKATFAWAVSEEFISALIVCSSLAVTVSVSVGPASVV